MKSISKLLFFALLALALSAPASYATHAVLSPAYSDAQFISASTTPPTEAQCFSVGRRCFSPQAIAAAYNYAPLYANGFNGQGMTIAIIDSYGSDTMPHDLH